MRTRRAFLVVAALFAAFTLTIQPSVQADTFGSGDNSFTIEFVNIGNPSNVADSTGFGAVGYAYRIGTYSISENQLQAAENASGQNFGGGLWSGDQPAANVSWYQAAAFVNWLNTSSGHQAAYNLTFSGSWSMALWSAADAWQVGGENLYRHKDAYYFLPSENEWYKAAYFDPNKNGGLGGYWLYPTGSDTAPMPVASGTSADTAVYDAVSAVPASVYQAGGLSPYGTMGQGANVRNWPESAYDGLNDSPTETRPYRGGWWGGPTSDLQSVVRDYGFIGGGDPNGQSGDIGFRVASVPEPSTYALLLMAGAGALWLARRRR